MTNWTGTFYVLVSMVGATLLSCNRSATLTETDKKTIVSDVTKMLHDYQRAVKESGLMAELEYLDSSSNFFWVPPGYDAPLSYDSIATILKQNAPQFKTIDNSFEALTVVPLTSDIAVYTGRMRSVMTDTSGMETIYVLKETGVATRRNAYWRLLSGQTDLLK